MARKQGVYEWWEERLRAGTQLQQAKKWRDQNMLVEVTTDPKWYGRIDTEALYGDYLDWHDHNSEPFSKIGFMLNFYTVTGATRGRSRYGLTKDGIRYVAVFQDLKWHREFASLFEDT